MQEIPLWYLGFVLLSTLLAIAAVWARRSTARIGAVMLLAVMLTLQFVALTDLLSRPKPAELETATNTIEEAKVLAASIREGRHLCVAAYRGRAGAATTRYRGDRRCG